MDFAKENGPDKFSLFIRPVKHSCGARRTAPQYFGSRYSSVARYFA